MAGTDIHIGIDVGGTFTDLAVSIPADNRLIRHKLSSTPASPDQAIIDGIAAVLSDHGLDLKVKALGLLEQPPLPTLENTVPADPVDHRQVLFSADGWIETPIFRRDSLGRDQTLHGPAVIDQLDATTVVFPGNRCIVDRWGNLVITVS